MFTELLLCLVVGGLIYFLVQRNRSQVLTTEDGWWGAGAPPDGGEDDSIRLFKVTTSKEELEVRFSQFVTQVSHSVVFNNEFAGQVT